MVVIAIILITTSISGCVWPPTHHNVCIIDINAGFLLNYTKVASLNYTQIEQGLEDIGYHQIETHLSTEPPPATQTYEYILFATLNITDHPRANTFLVCLEGDDDTKKASLGVSLTFRVGYPKDDTDKIEADKQYLKDKTNEFAQICNLTLNWDDAAWHMNTW
jgi:hypothetical protein